MKIAQVGVYFAPFMVGGVEWYMFNISKELVKRGNEVHVFTADSYGNRRSPREEVMEGILIHRVPLKLDFSYRLKVWDGLAKSIRRFDFDIIHSYDYAQSHTPVALRVGKETGSKTFVTVFDIHSMIPRPWYKQLPMKRLERYFASKTFPLSDKVLVRAPELIPPLLSLGVPKDKVVITPSGIVDEAIEPGDGKILGARLGLSDNRVVLYLGRINPLKGPQHIIEAAPKVLSKFPNTTFLIIGPDQGGYSGQLRRRVGQLGLEEKVRLLGPIYDQSTKKQAFALCDLFVLPTSFEGTSQAIFEAMAQGKPVLSTKVGGIPSQITDGKEGILLSSPVSVEELAYAIIDILSDKRRALEMGANARKKVEMFTYGSLVSQLIDIYRNQN